MRRALVLLPTYDEVDNLERIVSRIRAAVPDADILVLDDASPDGTGALADRLAASDARVHVRHRAGKEGLGAAYIDGFGWGLERGYDALIEIDADGSHPPETLPLMLERLDEGADLVIGSRWMPGGRVVNWPKRREALSRTANLYTRVMLGMPVRDATAGFRAYDARALAALDLASVDSRGYGFQVDMTYRMVRSGARVVEVPIVFSEREHGVSKMSGSIVTEAMRKVTGWGLQRMLRRGR
jgi:dolichol-phosphate mannosyltransferase